MRSEDLLEAALAYAKAGIPIFPVEPKGKKPINDNGFKGATTDIKKIKDWWRKHPNANIGSPLVEGLVALDFDGDKGRKTYEELSLSKRHLTVNTSRGFHLYVLAELSSKNSAMNGLDIKGGGKGGYIIMPPSVHSSGHVYAWKDSKIMSAIPLEEEPLSLLKNKSSKVSVTFGANKIESISDGNRDNILFSVACSLRRSNMAENVVCRTARFLNKKYGNPPVSKKQLAKIIDSSRNYFNDGGELFETMANVEVKTIDWLWYPYLPSGCITIIDGDPGVGKSFVTMSLASIISSGMKLPFSSEEQEPRKVLILSPEDDEAVTLRPRLEMNNANLENIRFLKRHITLNKETTQFIENEIIKNQPKLVIIDPLLGFMGADVDMHRYNTTTEFMADIDAIARTHNVCIIGVRHLTKADHQDASKRGIGSVGILARARSAVIVAPTPEDKTVIAMAHTKANYAEKGKTLLFSLTGGGKNKQPVLHWLEVSDMTANDLFVNPNPVGRPDKKSAIAIKLEFVLSKGPKTIAEIMKELPSGTSRRTVQRALSDELNAEKIGKASKTKWML